MEFTVQRKWLTQLSTVGQLKETVLHQGAQSPFSCYALEPPIRHDGVKPRAIPAARYRLTWRWSQRHGRNVPHVEDVAGFTEVEIHAGNFPHDTVACTCVAKSYSPTIPDFIGQSDAARDELYRIVEDCDRRGEEMFITYLDPPQGGTACNQPA